MFVRMQYREIESFPFGQQEKPAFDANATALNAGWQRSALALLAVIVTLHYKNIAWYDKAVGQLLRYVARRKNEEAYWAVRDQLLDQYEGQWIGFADGKVIASGSSPVTVFHAAEGTGLHHFFLCVGKEDSRAASVVFC